MRRLSEELEEIDEDEDLVSEAGPLRYYDDVSELTETQSMMSRTMNDIDYIPPECDLDQYIEDMLKNKNKRMMKQMELNHQQQLQQLKLEIQEEERRIFTDQAKTDLEEVRQLNAMDLNDILGIKEEIDSVSEQSKTQQKFFENTSDDDQSQYNPPKLIKLQKPQKKIDFSLQIKQARDEAAKKTMVFAEDKLIEQFAKEQGNVKKPEETKTKQFTDDTNNKQHQHKPATFKLKQENKTQSKVSKQIEDQLREVEQMLMQREDARSLQLENYMHQIQFAKKDLPPPQLPSILVQLGSDSGTVQEQMQGPWAYRPVQPCLRPIAPTNDNFVRFDIKIRLPKQLELDNPAKVKVLWSKEKETAEQEQRRREEIARKLKEQKMHLTKLVMFAQNVSTQKDVTLDLSLGAKIDKVQAICKQQIPDQKSSIAQLKSTKVELDKDVLIQLRSNESTKDQQSFQKLLLQEHQKMVQDISFSVAAISKLLPTSQADFNDYQVFTASQKVVQSDTPLEQALELNETDGDNSRRIDVKNENFGTIDVTTALSRYHRHLIHLDLSMNKIVAVQGGFDCPNLKRLYMSDNLIKEITPFMFQKCKSLRVLRLDINQISKITNLQALTELTELSLQNNKITMMEGFSALTKLRRLDLSFNQIKKLEGISSLQMLEFLELGKNQIDSVDAFTSPNNKLVFLTELYLYMNFIKSFPKLSLPQLRSLNLNRNPLTSLQIGYCPMLETLTASYCQLNQIGSLQLCPSLKDFDVSFNQLQGLNQVLNALQFCDSQQMRTLCFNDNLFNQVISDEQQAIQVAANLAQHTHTKQLNSLITRVFPMLDKLNNAFVKPQKAVKCADVCADEQMMSLWRVLNATCSYRSFVNKQLSQKLFVTVFSGTSLMQLLKSLLPMKVLQRLLSFNLAAKSEENVRLMQDSMIFQNHINILKQK